MAAEAVPAPCGQDASLTGLPKMLLDELLIHHIHKDQYVALLGTCKQLSAAVVEHSRTVALEPDVAVLQQSSSRRATVLGLAAGSGNVHLKLRKGVISLDVEAVRQCITQLTLCDVELDVWNIEQLFQYPLPNLRSLSLIGSHPGFHHYENLDKSAVKGMMGVPGDDSSSDESENSQRSCSMEEAQWDGMDLDEEQSGEGEGQGARELVNKLPALQAFRLESSGDEEPSLKMLTTALGSQVTDLTYTGSYALRALDNWPALQKLTVRCNPLEDSIELGWDDVEALLTHPGLRQVAFDSLHWKNDRDCSEEYQCSWDQLDLYCPTTTTLARMPLRGVGHVRVHAEVRTEEAAFDPSWPYDSIVEEQAAENLQRSQRVEWVPFTNAAYSEGLGLARDTPLFAFKNCMRQELIAACTAQMTGALVFDGCKRNVKPDNLPTLSHIASGVHTLVCEGLVLEGCSWSDVLRAMPEHISHVVLAAWHGDTRAFHSIFESSPPASLRQLTIHYFQGEVKGMDWLQPACESLLTQAGVAVAAGWDRVQLTARSSRRTYN